MRAEVLFHWVEPGTVTSIKDVEMAMGKGPGRHRKQARKAAKWKRQKLEPTTLPAPPPAVWGGLELQTES